MRPLLVLLLLTPALAVAQECPRAADHLILARLAAHEAGFDASSAEVAAIYAAIRNIADDAGISFAAAACAHSGRALRGETARSYVAELDERGSEPRSWPAVLTRCVGAVCTVTRHAGWDAYRLAWLALLVHSTRVVAAGHVVCGARTWGDERDTTRRPGWAEDLSCGVGLRNSFGRWE